MNRWLLETSWWQRALAYGVPFGVFMAGFSVVQGSSWVGAAIGGALGGVVFGLLMSRFAMRVDPEMRELGDAARAAGRRQVFRATWRGPVPEDPAVRAAASAIVAYQLSVLERQRRWAPFSFLGMTLLAGWLAVSGSAWWWIAVVLFAVMLALQLAMPAVLRRRAELLSEAQPPA